MPVTNPSLNEMGRSVASRSIRSSNSGLRGTIRKKNPSGGSSGLIGPGGFDFGTIRKAPPGYKSTIIPDYVVPEELADSAPVSTNTKMTTASETITVPPVTESGGILAGLKSGLTTYMPALLVIGAVVVGIVIIKSAGKK